MKDLIKIAEEQIEILEKMQKEYVTEDIVKTELSKEIRNWCEFISKDNNLL